MYLIPNTSWKVNDDEKNETVRIAADIFEKKEYSRAFEKMVIIDVGACIGLFTLYAYPFARKIYAIEPFKKSYDNLVKNIAENNLVNVEAFNIGLSNSNAPATVLEGYCYEGNRLVYEQGGQPVECKTLAQFINEHNIEYVDVLKVDTEGSEVQIFTAPDFPSIVHKINTIICETHGDDGFIQRLISQGFNHEKEGIIHLLKRV